MRSASESGARWSYRKRIGRKRRARVVREERTRKSYKDSELRMRENSISSYRVLWGTNLNFREESESESEIREKYRRGKGEKKRKEARKETAKLMYSYREEKGRVGLESWLGFEHILGGNIPCFPFSFM